MQNKKQVLDILLKEWYTNIKAYREAFKMAKASDRYGIIFQNLADAGCEKETAEKCTELILAEKYEQALALIKPQKKRLLEEIHANQKRVDSLDFLVYKIEKLCPAGQLKKGW